MCATSISVFLIFKPYLAVFSALSFFIPFVLQQKSLDICLVTSGKKTSDKTKSIFVIWGMSRSVVDVFLVSQRQSAI